jgi:hypothetical protein
MRPDLHHPGGVAMANEKFSGISARDRPDIAERGENSAMAAISRHAHRMAEE